MVQTDARLKKTTADYVAALERELAVQKLLLTGDFARGTAEEHSDIEFLVISPSFEGVEWTRRSDILSAIGPKVDPRIVSWGFTPKELSDLESGKGGPAFLGMMLSGSREVYATAPAV